VDTEKELNLKTTNMTKGPFKLRSGNSPAFKMMGSSPMKVDPTDPVEALKGEESTEYKQAKESAKSDAMKNLEANEPPDKNSESWKNWKTAWDKADARNKATKTQ